MCGLVQANGNLMSPHFTKSYQPAPQGGQSSPPTRNLLLITTLVLVLAVSAVGWYPGISPPSTPVYYNTTVTKTLWTSKNFIFPKATSIPLGADTYVDVISFDGEYQYFVTSLYNATINGKLVQLGLFNYVAEECHEESIALLVYLTPSTRGGILGLSEDSFPFGVPNSSTVPLLYITNGTLVFAEVAKPYSPQVVTPFAVIEPGIGHVLKVPNDSWVAVGVNIARAGFYWIVLEEWTNSQGTFVAWYINGRLVAKLYSPLMNATSLLGGLGPYKYNFVGIVNAEGWPLTGDWWYHEGNRSANESPNGWYPFNGSLVALAVYPTVLTPLQLDLMVSKGYLPGDYYLLFLASHGYHQYMGVWSASGFNPLPKYAKNTSASYPISDVTLWARGHVVSHVVTTVYSRVVTDTPPTGSYNDYAVIAFVGFNVITGVLALLLRKK